MSNNKPPSRNYKKAPAVSKKRRRQEKLQQYGVDLPFIPGVPVEVIPMLVHALKVATKFFQHEASAAFNEDWEEIDHDDNALAVKRPASATTTNQGSALDNVLNRIDSVAAQESEETKQQQQRKLKMKDAVQSWLQTVKRFARKDNYRSNATNNNAIENASSRQSTAYGAAAPFQSREQNRKSVPLCCFTYVWSLGQEHKRLAVRRAALYMNRLLLDKSADCRRYFLEENIWNWVQMLSNTISSGEQTKRDFDTAKQRLWQQEAHYLLLHLLRQNYGDLYPKLSVSEQYLRQTCSLELVEESAAKDGEEFGTTTNMASLRKLRDVAMEHGAEEIRKVTKLVQRCHIFMDVLVPRLGEPSSSPTPTVPAMLPNGSLLVDGDDDDEADDIDWEDGWEAEDGDPLHVDSDNQGHAKAVERTLQAMESMGGFKGGVMEIDLNASRPEPDPTEQMPSATPPPVLLAARERFSKCARFLADRHLPRIRAWLEGLTKADRLYSPTNQSSLVLMSFQQGQQRDRLRKSLVGLKAQMLSAVESAARLGLLTVRT